MTRFGTNEVLRGVTLEVPDGSTTVLLGRSGSGKSVLLKHVIGLIRPTSGTIRVDGHAIERLTREELVPIRREIGFVFQFAALFDSMTCGDNLRLGLIRQRMASDEIERRVVDSLALVGMPEVIDRFPAELSGGMKKRVGIARAVALRPRYILWDEPTSGLDPVTSATMDLLMQRAGQELGVTSVVVTHDLGSAFTVGDRVALLHEGRIRAVGTPDEIRASEDPVVRQFIEGRPE
ncbi:MAG TPA: ATP-binding cassette domain-containing protein [Gemmatimonadales bacterium]|nr:ATP-binding cassette domain-containing protein [Gemmatimonadales bacterium]